MPRESGPAQFGVLCSPIGSPAPDVASTVAVMANAGSVHHVGPNRLYVELARALAARGIPSLRFDIRNLGDSAGATSPSENYPYPPTAIDDVCGALGWLSRERRAKSFVVIGLCSGAHAAFHAAVELRSMPISAIVPINPLVFYWHDGMSLDTPDTQRTMQDAKYYARAIRDLDRWRRLLRGHSDIPYILRFIARRILQLLARAGRNVGARVGLVRSTRLAQDLEKVGGSGRRIHFVFSADDPGHELLRSEAPREVEKLLETGSLEIALIAGADHTFSTKAAREEAIQDVVEFVGRGASRPAGRVSTQPASARQ